MIEVEVETWCSKKRRMELIILECDREPKGTIAEGKPIRCIDEGVCRSMGDLCLEGDESDLCLLNALKIETRRR